MKKPTVFSRGDRVIWQRTSTPIISHITRIGYQGIWVRTGNQTYYIRPDEVISHRRATKLDRQTGIVRPIK